MDIKDLFIACNQALTAVVIQVKPEQLTLQVPAHMSYGNNQHLERSLEILAYENYCVPKVLAGETGLAGNKESAGDLLQEDYVTNYIKLGNAANEAVKQLSNLEKEVHISYGDFPASSYLTDISIQRSTAAFDVAELIGAEVVLADEAVNALQDIANSYAEFLRESGIFPPEVMVADNATPLDKLRAFTGRQPQDKSVIIIVT